MRRKKKEMPAMLTSASLVARRSVETETNPLSPEQIRQRKIEMLGVVETGLEQFTTALVNNEIKMDSTLDLERLVKLAMLLSGEPDTVVGTPTNQVEVTEQNTLESMLDENDDITNALVRELYERYNEQNDPQAG